MCNSCICRSVELHTESAALRVRGEGVKVTERLQRHNCGQVCVFLREEEASHSFSVSLSLRLFLFCVQNSLMCTSDTLAPTTSHFNHTDRLSLIHI